jgi:hypothetical protein
MLVSSEIRVRVKCNNPFCSNYFFADKLAYKDVNFKFCKVCKTQHSYQALVLQTQSGLPIKDLILESSRKFDTAIGMSDYLSISIPTLYAWLRAYWNMDFQSWKRTYICKANKCMLLDFQAMPITYKYHISETIRKHNCCACFIPIGDTTLLITSAKPSKLRDMFRNMPEVVSDGTGINKIRYPVLLKNLSEDEKKKC